MLGAKLAGTWPWYGHLCDADARNLESFSAASEFFRSCFPIYRLRQRSGTPIEASAAIEQVPERVLGNLWAVRALVETAGQDLHGERRDFEARKAVYNGVFRCLLRGGLCESST